MTTSFRLDPPSSAKMLMPRNSLHQHGAKPPILNLKATPFSIWGSGFEWLN